MATTVTMPQLGESVVEGTIAKWLVKEGDTVQEDQALVEVTTDKIDTEIPSPAAGVIGAIRVPEGQTVAIGTVLCEIVPAGAAGASSRAEAGASAAAVAPGSTQAGARPPSGPAKAAPSPAAPATAAAPRATRERPAEPPRRASEAGAAPRGGRAADGGEKPRVRSATARPGVALDEGRVDAARERRREGGVAGGNGGPAGERRVTPVVRKMAAERGVDLEGVTGTGVGGRVTKQDLLRHLELEPADTEPYGDVLGLEAPAPTPPPPASSRGAKAEPLWPSAVRAAPGAEAPGARPAAALRDYVPPAIEAGEEDRVEPFSKRRRIIAEHMVYSKAVSPHVYTMAEVDMSRVAALRESRKRVLREEGVNLTYLHVVIAAAVRALRDVPRMNAVVGEDELILRRDVNVGVAVETEGGLVVPVLRNAGRLSLRGIAVEVEELAARARDRKLRLEDLQGGTFTVSNPGREGNLVGFAIINQPQLGILRMGEIKKRPVVVEVDGDDAIVIRPVMLLSLSYDHRVIDGVEGNRFLYRVKEHLEAGEFEV